jgi:RNA polymerase sigma-B factor
VRSGTPEPSDDELFREYRETQDRALRNRLVERHLHLASYYVRRYRGRAVAEDDLRQIAFLGVVRAVERFDPDNGASFATFANRTIDGDVKRHFRDRTWAVRPPRRFQELHLHLRQADEDLQQELGRPPTVSELAERLGATQDDVLQALEAGGAYRSDSLDAPTGNSDGGRTLGDRLTTGEDGTDKAEMRMLLEEALKTLPERERLVVEMRFFEGLTQPEIAAKVGVSQSYLSRVLRRALEDLRRQMER